MVYAREFSGTLFSLMLLDRYRGGKVWPLTSSIDVSININGYFKYMYIKKKKKEQFCGHEGWKSRVEKEVRRKRGT